MNSVTIFRNGVEYLNLIERGSRTIDSGSLSREMLADDKVTLKVRSNSVLDIKINDYFTLFGENYRINQLPTVDKSNDSTYGYNIVAQGLMYDLLRCKFFNSDATGFKTTLDFPLIGNLELFLTAIANNMKRFSDKWEFKSYQFQKGETKTLTFGSDTCLSALQKICQEFKTDFWVKSENGKFVIHTGDFGNNIPVTFEYGKGNGLYSLSRSNVNEEGVINRMYVEGGSQNIPNSYRNFSDRLKFSDAGFLEDATLIAEMGLKEGELKLDDIYPHRTGKVTSLGATKFKFSDSTMDFDLNEKEADGITTKYLKPDTTAKIHFNTGNLAGYEFEIKKGGYKHSTKEFEIIPIVTTSGQKIPDLTSAAFQFAVADEYVLIDIYAPQIYITNAESKLLAKATEQFELKKQVKVSYDLIVDPEFIKKLQTKINVGDYVRVKDSKLAVDKVIRVNSIAQNFIKGGEWQENDYKITIADSYEISYASQMILDVREIKNINNITNQGEINYSLIGMKSTRELQSMVFDTDGYFDPINIKPNSIETGMLTVGSQSQQLSLSTIFRVNADGLKNKIVSDYGKLFSQTLNKTWDIPALVFNIPDDVARYVYAKCSKNGTAGSIVYDSAQRKFDADPNDFYFLVGILHSVVEGMRVLSITIGTTTINGGLIRAGIVSSLDGQTNFNLNTGEFKGRFTFSNGMDVKTAFENVQTTANGAVKTVDVEYYLSNSATSLIGGDWVTIAPTWVNGKYMWSRTKTTLVNGAINYTPSENGVCIAGAEGTSGVGISSITEYYLATNLANGIEPQASGWTTNVQTISDSKKYLWNYKVVEYTNSVEFETKAVIIGTYGDKGNDGVKGDDGIGIDSIVEYYLATASPSGVTISTSGWTSTVQTIDANKKYLWNYTKTNYSNGISENTTPVLIGTMGTNGSNGQGITSITENYYLSTSKTDQIGGSWTNTPPTWIPNTYLWTRSTIVWNNPTSTKTTPPIVDSSWEAVNAASQAAATALAQAQNAQTTAAATERVTNFLQTTIDGGVVSAGTLQVGDVLGANAGITGVTDRGGSSVRFYAGSTYAGKNTANWLMRDDGVEEQWFNGVMIRRRGVVGNDYFDETYNMNGSLAKRMAIINGKAIEEWYADGILRYQIGGNGIYYVTEIPESYTVEQFAKLNVVNELFLDATMQSELRQFMMRKMDDQNWFKLTMSTYLLFYNEGVNAASDVNKSYRGYKKSQSKTDIAEEGWYAKADNPMRAMGTKRQVTLVFIQNGQITKQQVFDVNTSGYSFITY